MTSSGPPASSAAPPAGLFASRWLERPAHVSELAPDALPAGFRAAGVASGIKKSGLDVALLVSDGAATGSAARFTSSAFVGAPVVVSRASSLDRLRAVLVSSGNANVADGERGLATARGAQTLAAELLGLEPGQVGVASTGVIARELPREKLYAGIGTAVAGLAEGGGAELAEALLTTDAGPKRACLEVALPSGASVRLAAQAKGAGMMAPRFAATLICCVETDAEIDSGLLDELLGDVVARTFDRVTVDGQLSTSDTVFVLASGASGARIEAASPDAVAFAAAFTLLMRALALAVVRDGEGASRVGRVVVRGGPEAAEAVARAVADSPLVKTALFGADPNFGRILQATGQALAGFGGIAGGPDGAIALDLEIEGRTAVLGGAALPLSREELRELEEAVAGPEVDYVLRLPGEGGEVERFFSDLSHAYVTLNADYTT